jgi:hypothetical protein
MGEARYEEAGSLVVNSGALWTLSWARFILDAIFFGTNGARTQAADTAQTRERNRWISNRVS